MGQHFLESSWDNYELIDAGGSKKLERWGEVVTIRPDRNAYFPPEMLISQWRATADWEFKEDVKTKSGVWKALKKNAPREWVIEKESLKFNLKLTKFKHLGLFPEQEDNWNFIKQSVQKGDAFLNLFAYTGAASVVAKSTGADVIHVDSVKQLISWAKENMISSDLEGIRWVHEDAFKFAQRCAKRTQKFDCIIMDPPAFGLGAKKERWKIEDKLEELLRIAHLILQPKGRLIVNTYTPKLTTEDITFLAKKVFKNEKVTVNELWRMTTSGKRLFYGNFIHVEKQ